MHLATHILALVGLDLLLLIGWFCIPLGLGGNFILLAAALLTAIVTGFNAVGWLALVLMSAGVALGEILEAILGSLVARRYGASNWGMLGAFLGSILGAMLGGAILAVVGSLLGAFLGSIAGAVLVELLLGKETRAGLRAGWGAFVGRCMATGIKLAIGTGMVVYLVIRTHGIGAQ